MIRNELLEIWLRSGQPQSLVGTLRAQMSFLKTGYRQAYTCNKNHYATFSTLHQNYLALLEELKEEPDEKLIKQCYLFFDGIRADLSRLFPHIDFSECIRPEESQQQQGRQLMIFVTGLCNLKCSYCFSKDMKQNSISAEDLKRIIQWAKTNGCDMVTPCGGEPLVYPHLGLFLDMISAHGMRTYFASNCTLPLSRYSQEQLGTIDLITFHMTKSLWQRPEHMRTFCENIETAQRHHIEIIARGNIITPDMDIMPWFDLVDRYGIKRMNIALTIPSGLHDNQYVDTAVFSDFVPVIRQCIDLCRQRNIDVSFAKPIPPCVFDDETAAWLLQYDNFAPMCNVHEDSGTRNVCLSPDMMFTPCLGVPQPQIPFSDKLTWDDLIRELGGEIDAALQRPLFEKCHSCFLFERKLCQGACLSYKYLSAL